MGAAAVEHVDAAIVVGWRGKGRGDSGLEGAVEPYSVVVWVRDGCTTSMCEQRGRRCMALCLLTYILRGTLRVRLDEAGAQFRRYNDGRVDLMLRVNVVVASPSRAFMRQAGQRRRHDYYVVGAVVPVPIGGRVVPRALPQGVVAEDRGAEGLAVGCNFAFICALAEFYVREEGHVEQLGGGWVVGLKARVGMRYDCVDDNF